MLREEQVLVKRLIEQTKKNQIRWRLPASAFGGYEFSSNVGCFTVDWLQNAKPTILVWCSGSVESIVICDYSVGALVRVIRKQMSLPPTSKTVPVKTKLDKVLTKIRRETLQHVLKQL